MFRFRRPRALLIACLLVATACGGAARDESGAIIEAGTENVFALKIGDCFDDPDEFGEITSVAAVPCTAAHDNEVFYTFDLPDGSFPGDEAIDEAAFRECVASFETYVGVAYESSILDVTYLSPTDASWDTGDREIACLLYHIDLEKLTGSMRASGV
ncbi:MAG: septum formation family protein [Acidimicrobiia bacterium]|nr:septum formation family protein [Acidimicrobiia bacterium]